MNGQSVLLSLEMSQFGFSVAEPEDEEENDHDDESKSHPKSCCWDMQFK